MEDCKSYKETLARRFHYHLSFWSGIFSFLTQSSPYDEAIDKIRKMNSRDAFKSDVQQLHRDFLNASRKQNLDLSGLNSGKQHR